MPSPFPGMDPYLEEPQGWQGRHMLLVAEISGMLSEALRPKYYSSIETRVYLSDREDAPHIFPDAYVLENPQDRGGTALLASSETAVLPKLFPFEREVKERWLAIRDAKTKRVITALELLSPTNKRRNSEGRRLYRRKRRKIVHSLTNLVEIDLLRAGQPMVSPELASGSDYRVVVVRSHDPENGLLWPIRLESALPTFDVPLRRASESVKLDLQAALTAVYDRYSFDMQLDYTVDPVPPLSPVQAKWAKKMLKAWKS